MKPPPPPPPPPPPTTTTTKTTTTTLRETQQQCDTVVDSRSSNICSTGTGSRVVAVAVVVH